MREELFEKYHLEFELSGIAPRVKSKKEEFLILHLYLDAWNDLMEVLDTLIPFLFEEDNPENLSVDMVGALFHESDNFLITGNSFGYKDLTIPKSDFIELVLEWSKFLLKHERLKSRV